MDRVGRCAGYLAASALAPYVLIKVVWVAGALVGALPTGSGLGVAQWVALNLATVAMAAVGVALALALVRPWGLRLPARPVVFCAWTGCGLLVALLPYLAISSLLTPTASDRSGASTTPAWEDALIQVGFVGMGLGLAVAVPAYLHRRWPHVLAGRLREHRGEPAPAARLAVPISAAIGVLWLYWAAGGGRGLTEPGARDTDWYLLELVFGIWAVLGAAATGAIATRRPAGLRTGPVVAAAWLGSGSMFAWSAWMLPLVSYAGLGGRPDGFDYPPNLGVAAAGHLAAAVCGAVLLRTTLTATRGVPAYHRGQSSDRAPGTTQNSLPSGSWRT